MKWFFIALLLGSVSYVHFRGQVRHKLMKQLFDLSAFMAPINVFMYAFSKVKANPYVAVSQFPELAPLAANWKIIRDEAINLREQQRIQAAQNNNDASFNSFFKTGWKRFYLKWYDANHPSAAILCPNTVALLRGIPTIKAAMFAELPPDGVLNPHRDPYAGSIRYHLGLVTPNNDGCYIKVDGQDYSWRDGECVMFDETYIHEARNTTDIDRIILFCDIERPMRFNWAQAVNHFLGSTLITAASSPNQEGDQTGLFNRLFHYVWVIGQYRRRYKRWNRTAYKLTKIALIAGLVALIWVA
ncbi:MAG: aspartyl/asparaginyl beta-hydroxylase domain-containing protein [Methylophilaceae bacterium]